MRLFLSRRKNKIILLIIISVCLMIGHFFGVFLHPFEVDFFTNFSYPLDVQNLREIIESLKEGHDSRKDLLQIPEKINSYDYRFMIRNEGKCKHLKDDNNNNNSSVDEISLLIIVKSAIQHATRRHAIRTSWGFEKRFSDVSMRTVFILGSCNGKSLSVSECQDAVDEESLLYEDIIQADFEDSYYNNTVKTMMAIKWVVEYCSKAHFIMFIDDDYYLSVKNLLKFLRNPLNASPLFQYNYSENKGLVYDYSKLRSQFDGRLYAGYVFPSSSPMRHKISKWYVSLEEYPYSHYPPYVTAGAFVLSNESLIDMHYASLYTKHFRFDDIFIGILAKRVSIIPLHNKNFYFWKLKYTQEGYANVIASHGFSDSKELLRSWHQQKSLGFA